MTARPCGDTATQDLLGLYVLGRLDAAAAEVAGAHLSGCLACQGLADSLRTVARALDLLGPAERTGVAAVDVAASAHLTGSVPGDDRKPAGPAGPTPPDRCRFDPTAAGRAARRGRPALSPSGCGVVPGPRLGQSGDR